MSDNYKMSRFQELGNKEDFDQLLNKERAILFYFSTQSCSVCTVLKPKVELMVRNAFPNMRLVYVQSDQLPEVAALNKVFTAPVILVFFEGREYVRKSRSISVSELEKEIQRPYSLVFE